MYNNHFGFKEKPFQLVPNPAYLFLSKSHEEALAHLHYAISQGDGFVEITGEVGTGKTTLCRAFVESLDEGIETAYIFNPKLSADELLEAVHDEFGISYKEGASTKALIDSLNRFLLEKKAQGKKILLIIDEAQNLSREVLEQIRLLSNLETSTEKLLQIVLAGQPELGEMLSSYELRQLGQRITLSAHLRPLSYADTARYIRHRLHIAGQGVEVRFSGSALRKIYRHSKGIPRRIHVLCDRALLVAYVLGKNDVTGRMVRTAIQELSGRENVQGRTLKKGWIPLAAAGVAGAALAAFLGIMAFEYRFPKTLAPIVEKSADTPAPPPNAAVPQTQALPPSDHPAVPTVPVEPVVTVAKSLPFVSRAEAFSAVMALWGLTGAQAPPEVSPVRYDPAFFQSVADKNGFELYRVEGDFTLLAKLNLPAILSCYVPGGDSLQYLVLCGMDDDTMRVARGTDGAGEPVVLSNSEIAARWSGVAYVPWKNFLSFHGMIPLAASKESILMLKRMLHEIGFRELPPGPVYDEATRAAVKEIQKKYGIEVDGLVGSLTKILLYNEQGSFYIPHLNGKTGPTDRNTAHATQ